MKQSFKTKLQQLKDKFAGRTGKTTPADELKKILQYGVMGESGENYFLFIYRDYYRTTPYYGAVIFLDKPDSIRDLPVTVTGLEENGKEQLRNIYVTAALHYLETGVQNTMSLAGKSAAVFGMAREKILPHMEAAPKKAGNGKDPLDEFRIPSKEQNLEWREIPPAPAPGRFDSTRINKHLELLEEPGVTNVQTGNETGNEAGNETGSETGSETETSGKNRAIIGLNLVSQHLDLSGEKQQFFEPVLLPLRLKGKPGKPLKASSRNIALYDMVLDEPGMEDSQNENHTAKHAAVDLLNEFFTAFCAIDRLSSNRGLKARLLNGLFFERLMDIIPMLPPGVCYCRLEDDKTAQFRKMRPVNIKNIHLRLAPHLKKDAVLRFFIRLTDAKKKIHNAADRFEIIKQSGCYALLFETGDDESRLGILPPIDDNTDSDNDIKQTFIEKNFQRLLDFLAVQPEIKTYELENVVSSFSGLHSKHISLEKEPLKKYELSILPVPVFNIYFPDKKEGNGEGHVNYRMELTFDYDSPVREFTETRPEMEVCVLKRNEAFEKQCKEVVESDSFLDRSLDLHRQRRAVFHSFHFRDNDFTGWLAERGRKYLEKGFKIYSMKWKRYIGSPGSRIRVRASEQTDWLEFTPYVYDPALDSEVELSRELDMDTLENGMVQDKKGVLYTLTEEDIKKLTRLIQNTEQLAGKFRVPSRNHVLIGNLYDTKTPDDESNNLQAVRNAKELERRLEEFEKIREYPLGKDFNGTLRQYQGDGFKWLRFLKEYRFSGCLADDMGLGKTVQTLALLQTLKEENQLNRSLLVVPVSALPNWEAEINRFAPGLTYHIHMGAQRNSDKNKKPLENTDLIITSYGTLRSDIGRLADETLDWVILDESQNIKNPVSQTARAVKILNCNNRLALSGTPVENNTLELWSLFDFLMPGFLGTRPWFQREMMLPIERDRDEDKIQLLKKMIFPFVLRRRKEEVETELPEKSEMVSMLKMGDAQSMVYGETARRYRESLAQEIDVKGVPGASMKIIEAMLRLRQICLFPGLAGEKYDEMLVPSAKFDHLRELLEDILAENHKVLIFSQFVKVLERIRGYCDHEAVSYSYLDGSMAMRERELMVKRFQEDDRTRVFLLSLKAGGVALNLTAADYVVIFDPWWNPAVEAQAIDRSHRIGQTKKVMVYRMVMKDTIEEKILQLQERKKALVDDLVTSDSLAFKDLGKEDIMDLLNF